MFRYDNIIFNGYIHSMQRHVCVMWSLIYFETEIDKKLWLNFLYWKYKA